MNDLRAAWATLNGSIAFDLVEVVVVAGQILPNLHGFTNLGSRNFVGVHPEGQVASGFGDPVGADIDGSDALTAESRGHDGKFDREWMIGIGIVRGENRTSPQSKSHGARHAVCG